jgi:hypothetical protein
MVLLGATTLFAVGGPFLIGFVLRGGASPAWPPDRPIEWAVLLGVSGLVLALMMTCLSMALVNRREIARGSRSPDDPEEDRP